MKYIDCKLISKADKADEKNKYLLTVELTDYDIEMFEEFGWYPTAEVYTGSGDLYDNMNDYLYKIFKDVFHKIWRKFD